MIYLFPQGPVDASEELDMIGIPRPTNIVCEGFKIFEGLWKQRDYSNGGNRFHFLVVLHKLALNQSEKEGFIKTLA